MQHVDIEAVESKAAEFEAFATTPGLATETTADYRSRAQNLRDFAKELRRWR